LGKDSRNLFAEHAVINQLIEGFSILHVHISNVAFFSKNLAVKEAWKQEGDEHEEN